MLALQTTIKASFNQAYFGILVASQLGCSLPSKQPPLEEICANIGTNGVVSAITSSEIKLPEFLMQQAQGRTTGHAVGQGAKGSLAEALLGSIAGALLGSWFSDKRTEVQTGVVVDNSVQQAVETGSEDRRRELPFISGDIWDD